MKRLLSFALLLPALAVAKVPVEEDILDRITDTSSPYYYTGLMMRYNAGDETLTDEDYHYLYYGYAYQDAYKPLNTNPDLDRVLLLASGLDPDAPDVGTLEAIISVTVPEFFIRFLSFPAHTKDVRSMIDWQQNIIL